MRLVEIQKGIEGDYIETKDDNLFFDVKGFLHPSDRKICFLRFFPDRNGDRERNGIKYKKIYNLNDRYSFLKEHYPKYLFFSKQYDLELQGVLNNDINKIYTPREYFNKLKKRNNLKNLENYSLEFCELMIQEGDIPENSIGITGSPMIGLDNEKSDIDIIIYGTETSLTFQRRLNDILNNTRNCRRYNLEEFKSHYTWRFGGSNISFENFMKSESRKLHQGKFHGIDFFIRYIKSPKDWKGSYYDYQYKNLGNIRLIATILNSKNSIFTPCSYRINTKNILDTSLNSNDINISDICEINSFRGRFCEHAKEGEKVLVEGKLEKVKYKNKLEYFRILLTDPNQDRMIII